VTPATSTSDSLGSEPKAGNVYLVEERRPRHTYELLQQSLSGGCSGLIVTRDYPKKMLSEDDIGHCKIIWLTNLVGEGRINPTAIGILMGQIRSFVESHPRTAVVFDGLEYMVSVNTYDRMFQFMHQLLDVVVTNECVLLVPVDPRTMTQRELALLERSMEPIVPKAEAEDSEESMIGGDEGVLKLLDVRPR
jgi:hypothetical protein